MVLYQFRFWELSVSVYPGHDVRSTPRANPLAHQSCCEIQISQCRIKNIFNYFMMEEWKEKEQNKKPFLSEPNWLCSWSCYTKLLVSCRETCGCVVKAGGVTTGKGLSHQEE